MTALLYKKENRMTHIYYFFLRSFLYIVLFLTNEIRRKDRKRRYIGDLGFLNDIGNLEHGSEEKKDTISWLPYTFWAGKREASDPVNIICYGVTSEELASLIVRRDPGWMLIRGSYQFIFAQGKWRISSVQLVKNVAPHDGMQGVRYHVRLTSHFSSLGVSMVIGGAHYEYEGEKTHEIISWDDARDTVVHAIGRDPSTCLYIQQPSVRSWHGTPSDGKAAFMRLTE